MKTPTTYQANIRNRIITKEMLGDCIFSVNKRAKNCRDKAREYKSRLYWNHYLWGSSLPDYQEKYEEKRDFYYEQKNKMLAIANPDCIHIEKFRNRRGELITKHYLFFQFPNHSFHHPLTPPPNAAFDIWASEKYPGLEIVALDEPIITFGKGTAELLSCNFVKKVIDLIESGDFTFNDIKTA